MSDGLDCDDLRRRLAAGEPSERDEEHLAGCPACRRFAGDLELARRELRSPAAELRPPPEFPARVLAEIDRRRGGSAETLGWAAVRLMPAAVVLAAVLGWLAAQAPPRPTDLLTGDLGDEALLVWVVSSPEPPAGKEAP